MMGLINDLLDEQLENELLSLLKNFVSHEDFFEDCWRPSKVFDYVKCIKRIVENLNKINNYSKYAWEQVDSNPEEAKKIFQIIFELSSSNKK